jgi:fructosamine-3-kinase
MRLPFRAEYSDATAAKREAHGHYPACYHAEAEVALLAAAMLQVFGNYAARIEEGCLR